MIMNGRSAKNLNWGGVLVLACLGLALLPVPVRAQQPTPDNVVPIQVQPAKKKAMSVDEQIEALRRVLQQLEEQKRKEQGQGAPSKPANQASPWPANWKEINKAIEVVNRLSRDAEDKRAALREAEIRLRQAHAEVEKLQGKSTGSHVLPSNVVPISPR